MQPYGRCKRGSGKLHSHSKCAVCNENSFNKSKARQLQQKEIKEIQMSYVIKDGYVLIPKKEYEEMEEKIEFLYAL